MKTTNFSLAIITGNEIMLPAIDYRNSSNFHVKIDIYSVFNCFRLFFNHPGIN